MASSWLSFPSSRLRSISASSRSKSCCFISDCHFRKSEASLAPASSLSNLKDRLNHGKIMTGNGHIELLKVTSYNFQPSRACINSYTKLQAGVSYTSLPKYTTFIVVIFNKTAFILNFPLQVEICKTVSSCVNTYPSYTATSDCIWPIKIRTCTASTCQIDSILWGERMAGSTATAQCGIAGATSQVEWPQRCSMCTFPVMWFSQYCIRC